MLEHQLASENKFGQMDFRMADGNFDEGICKLIPNLHTHMLHA
jgi:hypothetical protein